MLYYFELLTMKNIIAYIKAYVKLYIMKTTHQNINIQIKSKPNQSLLGTMIKKFQVRADFKVKVTFYICCFYRVNFYYTWFFDTAQKWCQN